MKIKHSIKFCLEFCYTYNGPDTNLKTYHNFLLYCLACFEKYINMISRLQTMKANLEPRLDLVACLPHDISNVGLKDYGQFAHMRIRPQQTRPHRR